MASIPTQDTVRELQNLDPDLHDCVSYVIHALQRVQAERHEMRQSVRAVAHLDAENRMLRTQLEAMHVKHEQNMEAMRAVIRVNSNEATSAYTMTSAYQNNEHPKSNQSHYKYRTISDEATSSSQEQYNENRKVDLDKQRLGERTNIDAPNQQHFANIRDTMRAGTGNGNENPLFASNAIDSRLRVESIAGTGIRPSLLTNPDGQSRANHIPRDVGTDAAFKALISSASTRASQSSSSIALNSASSNIFLTPVSSSFSNSNSQRPVDVGDLSRNNYSSYKQNVHQAIKTPLPISSQSAVPTASYAATDNNFVDSARQLFRLARDRLSPVSFNAFISSVEALHSQNDAQQVHRLLADVSILFGIENRDLYAQFERIVLSQKR